VMSKNVTRYVGRHVVPLAVGVFLFFSMVSALVLADDGQCYDALGNESGHCSQPMMAVRDPRSQRVYQFRSTDIEACKALFGAFEILKQPEDVPLDQAICDWKWTKQCSCDGQSSCDWLADMGPCKGPLKCDGDSVYPSCSCETY
jgi:hypothetical protein